MKFTKEEISLCKQIAKRYRKEIEFGSSVYQKDKIYIVNRIRIRKTWTSYYLISKDVDEIAMVDNEKYRAKWEFLIEKFTPLWTISDCLSWLDKIKDITLRICSHPDFNQTTVEYDDSEYYGTTPLEACLKAVLAVLEEKK